MTRIAVLAVLLAAGAACRTASNDGRTPMSTTRRYDLSTNEKIHAAIQEAAGFEPYSVVACTLSPFEFPSVLLVHHLSDGPRGYFADRVYVPDRLDAGPALATRGWAAADRETRGKIALDWTRVALTSDLVEDRPKRENPRVTLGDDGSVAIRATEDRSRRIVNFLFGADGRVRFPTYDLGTDDKLRKAIWEATGIEADDLSRFTRRVDPFPGVILIGRLISDWGYGEIGYFAGAPAPESGPDEDICGMAAHRAQLAKCRYIADLGDSGPAMELAGFARADRQTRERLALAWAEIMHRRLSEAEVKTGPDGSVTVKGTYDLPKGMLQDAPTVSRSMHVLFRPDGSSGRPAHVPAER